MRRIAYSLLGIIGILLGIAIIVPFFINVNDYKPQIISKVKESTGRDLTIDGKMSLSLLPTPQLSISQVGLTNIPGGSPQNMIQVKNLTISVELLPLIKKQIKIKDVELDHPEIFLEKLPNGQTNWTFDSTASSPSSFDVSLDKLLINKGRLIYHEKGKDVEITDINATSKMGTLQGPFNISGHFKIYGQVVKLDTKLGPLKEQQDVYLKVQVGESISTLEGKATLTPVAFKGKLNTKVDVKTLQPASTIAQTSSPFSGPLLMDGNLVADADSILLSNAKFELGSAHPTGELRLFMKDNIQVHGNLNELPGQGRCTFTIHPTAHGFGGVVNGNINQASELLNWLQIDTKSIPPSLLGPLTLSTHFNMGEVLHLTKLNLNIQQAQIHGDISWQSHKENPVLIIDLQTPKIENVLKLLGVNDPKRLGMSKLRSNIQWNPKSFHLSHIKGQLGTDFSFAGDVAIDQTGSKPKVNAVLNLNPINLGTLMASHQLRNSLNPEGQIYLVSTKHASTNSRWSHAPLDLSFLNKFDGHFDISATKLIQSDFVVSHPKLIASLQNGRLNLTSLTGSIFEGSLTGNGHLTSDNTLRLHTTLTDANLKHIPAQGATVKIIGGKLSMSLDMSTHGKSMADIIHNLAGPVNISAKDGLINGFDLHTLSQRLGSLQDPRSLIGLLTTSMGKGHTPFTSFKGDIVFQNGVGTIQAMHLIAPDGEGHASGQIDLPRYYLNIHAEFRLTQHPNLPTFHMQLVGPIDNPSRKLDTASLEKYMLENVFKGIIGKLGKGPMKAGEILGSIIGGDKAPKQQQPDTNQQKSKPEQIVKDIFKGIF